jgi:hypothetical protein
MEPSSVSALLPVFILFLYHIEKKASQGKKLRSKTPEK